MTDRTHETKVVKLALSNAGIKARVSHGNGTAWGWLHVYVGSNPYPHLCAHHIQGGVSSEDCLACTWYKTVPRDALAIAMNVTGRKGEYDGKINVLTQ